jgi:hypothetical protein
MKHVKLFEHFTGMDMSQSKVGLIVAEGDFSGITSDGESVEWIQPSEFTVTYYPNPSEDLIQEALNKSGLRDLDLSEIDLITPEEVGYEIVGGDQNGSNLYQSGGTIMVLTDGTYSPNDYKRAIESAFSDFDSDRSLETDYCYSILGDQHSDSFTPEFLAHCRAVVEEDPNSQRYYPDFRKFTMGPKMRMKPRIELNFNVA